MILNKLRKFMTSLTPRQEHIYYVPLKDIVIPVAFAESWIGEQKWQRKKEYYKKHGCFESQIVLSKNFTLIDGYSSYKLAKQYHIKEVPVIFKNDTKNKEK